MTNLRPIDWLRGVLVVTAVVAAVAVELVNGGVREFYKEHPIQAGVLTGALLAASAYFGIDAIVARMNAHRWAPIAHLAFVSLAYQTTLLIDTALWLATGIAPTNDAAPTAHAVRRWHAIRRRLGVAAPTGNDLGAVQHHDYVERLSRLLRDAEWLDLALISWDRAKWRNRDVLATWAAAMLTTGETSDVLNRLAHLNESLSDLQRDLRVLRAGPFRPQATGPLDQISRRWMEWHAQAASVREDLMRAGRGLDADWIKFRGALPADLRRELERRDLMARSGRQAREMLARPFVAPNLAALGRN